MVSQADRSESTGAELQLTLLARSTPDNTKFASCGGDRSVFVWDVASGDQFRRFQGHSAKVNAVAFNAEASILASGASLGEERLIISH